MKTKLILITLLALGVAGVFFTSCNNDLDIVAPYKDTTVVYCLIDLNDTVHYVRIHKAFLGADNAYEMAQYTDSFYHKNVLSVKLERWKNNQLYGVINFTRDSSIAKDTGVFANTPNIIYKSESCNLLSADSKYRLVVRNSETGSVVTSVTQMIQPTLIANPSSGTINLYPGPFVIRIASGKHGKIYDIKARFNYIEQQKNNPNITENKSVVWNITQVTTVSDAGSELINYAVGKDDFYQFCKSSIKVDNNVVRYSGKLDFYFTAGDQAMYEYLRINNASGVNASNGLLFTNIENGLGIFASRRTEISLGKSMAGNSIGYLISGPLTSQLGFIQ